MAAGDSPAGVAPAGHDPVASLSPRTVVVPVVAPFYDPSLRDYPLNANGQLTSIHPVDQAVALALSIDQGEVTGVPTFGHTLRDLPRGSVQAVEQAARDAVSRALSRLVLNGDITVLGVDVALPRPGLVRIDVRYRNERLAASEPRQVRAVV